MGRKGGVTMLEHKYCIDVEEEDGRVTTVTYYEDAALVKAEWRPPIGVPVRMPPDSLRRTASWLRGEDRRAAAEFVTGLRNAIHRILIDKFKQDDDDNGDEE